MQLRSDYVNSWYLDSGATEHMTHRKDWFVNYRELVKPVWVRVGDGAYLEGMGRGDINISAFDGKQWHENHLADVLHVPELKYSLFSSGTAMDKGLEMLSNRCQCKFLRQGRVVVVGERGVEQKLFVMKFFINVPKAYRNAEEEQGTHTAAVVESIDVWHQRLMH